MATIELTTNTTESLESLTERQQQGYSVMRSAHVGNARAYNLAIAAQGIPMLLVDHTVTGRDKNYRPEMIIRGGAMKQIADLGSLAFRTMPNTGDDQMYLDQLHADSLQVAFPDTQIQTNTTYLRTNEAVVGEALKIITAEMPELFTRFVNADEASTSSMTADTDLQVLQLADDPRRDKGVLVPNEADILVNFIIEQLDSQRDTQYHISGPDMVRYMTQPKSRDDKRTPLDIVNTLYNSVRQKASFGDNLPEVMDVQLVTGQNARFATTAARSVNMDNLLSGAVTAKELLAEDKSRRAVFFKSPSARDDNERQNFLQQAKQTQILRAREINALADSCSDVFVNPTDAPYVSQYDVIDEGGLYVPPAIKAMSMYALKELFDDIGRLREGKP